MAKCGFIVALCFVCIFSLFSFGYSLEDRFFVEGKVYCDTCRAKFVTKISEYMKGAEVKLECRNISTESVTYSTHTTTDETGTYRMPVDGDHEEDICEVFLIKSSRSDCDEIIRDNFVKQTAEVDLTRNNGISSPIRQANPLSFLIKKPLSQCTEVLRELGFTSTGALV
ncbi:unnamed protein product [Citrullus colocynthis]|uniref:Olee1-like protein n=1 Tax=Citrullus colocynthis TaxID=252529 RepID=A0ABP0Z9E5_9ROSI